MSNLNKVSFYSILLFVQVQEIVLLDGKSNHAMGKLYYLTNINRLVK